MKRRSVSSDPINDLERIRGIIVRLALDVDNAVPVSAKEMPTNTKTGRK